MNFLNIPVEITKNIGAGIPLLMCLKEKYSKKRRFLLEDIGRFFNIYEELLERYKDDLDFENKTVLEIGPGNSLAMALLFLASGAKKVILVDRFRYLFWDKYDIDSLKKVLLEIRKKNLPYESIALESVNFINNKFIKIDNNRIEYLLADVSNLPLDSETIDIVFSNAVLEHIHNPEKAINEISRVTKSGGIHEIDLSDHFFKSMPLRLLRYPDWLWNSMTWCRPGYTNRLRFSDWRSLFRKAGFSERKIEITREYVDVLNIKIHKKFNLYPLEELKILAFQIFLQKQKNAK